MFCTRVVLLIVCTLVCSVNSKCFAETDFFKIHNVEVNKDTVRIFRDKTWIQSLAFKPDAKQLAVGVTINPLRIIDIDTGKTWKVLKAPKGVIDNKVTISAWSPDAKTLAVFWGTKLPDQEDYTVSLYDAESLALNGTSGSFKVPPTQLQWASNERMVLKFEQDPANLGTPAVNFQYLNIKSGETSPLGKANNGATPIIVPSGSSGLLALGAETTFKLLEAETQKELATQKLDSKLQGFAFSEDGKSLLIDTLNSVHQYDVATKKLKIVVLKKSYERGNWYCAYGPDSKTLVCKIPNRLRLVDISNGKTLKTSPRIDDEFVFLVAANGKQLAISELGTTLELWQVSEADQKNVVAAKQKPMPIKRIWVRDDGYVIGEAEVLKKGDKIVVLVRKNDPAHLLMPINMLSPKDQEFVKSLPNTVP